MIIFAFSSSVLNAQERPFRIGVKIGFPNGIGGNLEYATPLLSNKLAVSFDYSSIKADSYIEPDKASLNYWEAGLNYYFFKEGSGVYLNGSYGSLKADLTLTEIESDIEYDKYGTAYTELDNTSFNLKLGAKFGRGLFFRTEIGYAFTSLDDTVDIQVVFPDNSQEFHREEIPSELTQGLLFNIGFGVAF